MTPENRVRRLESSTEAEQCAEMMVNSEPWLTLGRTFAAAQQTLQDPRLEVYVAEHDARVLGFVIINMQGAFSGYIQTVCVSADHRGQGLGSALIAYAERRIFRDRPNVFICVSSFNSNAQRLYQRLGYTVVGELTDYMIRGHSELLLRKSQGAWSEFKPQQ